MEEDDLYWDCFTFLVLDKISREIRGSLNKEIAHYGITSAHAMYLIALKMHDNQTLMSLSKFLDVDPSNTFRMLKALKAHGYISDDRRNASRKFHVFLTEEGRQATEEIQAIMDRQMESHMRGLSEEDISRFKSILVRYFANIQDETEEKEYNQPFYCYAQ
jgi:DNA-binding MarR family transcriptional regulator